MLAEARAAGIPMTVETCPHYLSIVAEEIPDGDPRYKCAPPIRERANREQLWDALRFGIITTIGSDHSPAPPELKHLATGDLARAWGGIASLQLMLPIVWTEARQRDFGPFNLAAWMSHRPARFLGLEGRKGAFMPGCDADLVIFDPDASFIVKPEALFHRHRVTPYEGRRLQGQVMRTYLRGRKVYDAGRFADEPSGVTVVRSQSESERHA